MKKFNKLFTFKAKDDLKDDILSVIDDEETMSSFIRKAVYAEIMDRKLKDKGTEIKRVRQRPITLG